MKLEIDGSSPLEAGDELRVVDEIRQGGIRRGDIVYFERVGPQKVEMRVLSSEHAHSFIGKKYLVDPSSQAKRVRLVEIVD
jgi:hypothetical protein